MNKPAAARTDHPRRIGQSILALFVGFVVSVVLSLGTDFTLHFAGVWRELGQPMTAPLLLIATIYRSIYATLSAYVVARLAPYGPLQHALIGGAIGLALSLAGAAATWNRGLGPHWYSVALILLALPTAWLGGKLRVLQLQKQVVARAEAFPAQPGETQ